MWAVLLLNFLTTSNAVTPTRLYLYSGSVAVHFALLVSLRLFRSRQSVYSLHSPLVLCTHIFLAFNSKLERTEEITVILN
jgi:hypothetical protein